MTALEIVPPAAFIAEFTIPGEPVSKARARFTNYRSPGRMYTPAKTLDAEKRIAAAYLAVAKPCEDVDKAFGVRVEFLHQTGQRRDIDNMLKAVLDGLNKVAFPDDVQVTQIECVKRRVPKGEAETRVTIFDLGRIEKPRGRCLRCGDEFAQYASTSARKFCGRECGYAYRREVRRRDCAHCGERFLAHGTSDEARFCGIACSSAFKRVSLTCLHCGGTYTLPRSLAKKGRPACSPECRAALAREHRKSAAKGTCATCAGPTSKKQYVNCRPCNYAASGTWADKHIRKGEPE